MVKKQHTIPVIVSALFFLSLIFGGSVQPAGAVGVPFVKWKINLILTNNKPTTELTVQKWINQGGGQLDLADEKIITLFCQKVGNPTISNGKVTLDGSSYVTCDVPSIKAVALSEWGLLIADSCSAKRPYITGEVTLEGNPIDSNPGNPVFYRDDIQFNTPLNVSTQQATLDASFGNIEAESASFVISSSGHIYSANFVRSGNAFSPSFFVDGSPISATPAIINQPAIISNLASTIYFGYSPISGEYFQGDIGETEVDPVCPTTG